MYSETAAYGQIWDENEVVEKSFYSADGKTKATAQVELFTWEKLDFVDTFKNAFGL